MGLSLGEVRGRLASLGSGLSAQRLDVGVDHHPNEVAESHLRLPAEPFADLRRVADESRRAHTICARR
jgi:hypothetical protein